MFGSLLCDLVADALCLARAHAVVPTAPEVIIKRLVCWLSGYDLRQFYQNWNAAITFNVQHFWQKYEQFLLGRPLAYLTNQVQLGAIKLWTDERTLIPRPESYDLAVQLIANIKHNFAHHCQLSILEIGTGTGLISILLAKAFPQAQITATDISQHAANVARYNAVMHQVSNLKILVGNFLEPIFKINAQFNIVVCNPPYLTADEFKQRLALHCEPRISLVADYNDGTLYYHKIQQVLPWLKADFIGLMEINPGQKEIIKNIFRQKFAYLSFRQDWQSQTRYIYFYSSPFKIN